MKNIIEILSFGQRYLTVALFYIGFGLLLWANIPDVPFVYAQNGCGGEESCDDGSQCVNGEYVCVNPDSDSD